MSKYIPKTRVKKNLNLPYKPVKWEWSNQAKTPEKEVSSKVGKMPLDVLTFKDVYVFPFVQWDGLDHVYDSEDNFLFQFQFPNKETQKKVVAILNGELLEYKRNYDFIYEDGEIKVDGKPFILIRGWGNLTGIGGHNLDPDRAVKVQDTLAEYIVEKLNRL